MWIAKKDDRDLQTKAFLKCFRIKSVKHWTKQAQHILVQILPLASPLGSTLPSPPFFFLQSPWGGEWTKLSSPDPSSFLVASRGSAGRVTRRRVSRIKSLISYTNRKPWTICALGSIYFFLSFNTLPFGKRVVIGQINHFGGIKI